MWCLNEPWARLPLTWSRLGEHVVECVPAAHTRKSEHAVGLTAKAIIDATYEPVTGASRALGELTWRGATQRLASAMSSRVPPNSRTRALIINAGPLANVVSSVPVLNLRVISRCADVHRSVVSHSTVT